MGTILVDGVPISDLDGYMNTTTERRRLFQDTVARRVRGGWCLMNRRAGGFASSAIPYNTLIEIHQDWDITIGARGSDEHGEYVEIEATR